SFCPQCRLCIFCRFSRPCCAHAFPTRRSSDLHARGRREIWTCEGRPGAALTVWHRPGERVSSEEYRQDMAQRCASVMVALLRGGQAGHTGFMNAEQALVPVRPADMAVLVRTGREAQIIRQALAERGVRSVYLSDKDSVLATQEA